WAYNPPYVRCLRRGDTASIEALESMLLETAVSQLRWADDTLRRLTGRPVPHVVLLHAGAFDAHILDRLLTTYEKEGVRWVSLDERGGGGGVARRGPPGPPPPAHARAPPRPGRGALVGQVPRPRQLQGVTFTASPAPLLERLCLDAKEAPDAPDP